MGYAEAITLYSGLTQLIWASIYKQNKTHKKTLDVILVRWIVRQISDKKKLTNKN